jgi:glucosamine-6-phosphate deaminase
VTAFHSDEYVGIAANHPGSFRKFLQERVVQWVPLSAFHGIRGERNPVSECLRLNALIANRRIDVVFAGIGENGHLAFNDPPADFKAEGPFVLVKLDTACRVQQVKEGWFGTLDQVPSKAITMAIRKIMSADAIVCTVPDKRKAKAVKAVLEGPMTSKVPASILQRHPRASVFLEPDSASLLGPSPRPMIYPLMEIAHCPETLAPGTKRFHLLVAGDWKGATDRELTHFARKAVKSGAASMTAWGPGALRMEVAFESGAAKAIPAAAYKPDELDAALFYFLEDVKEELRTVNSWVAVLAGPGMQRDRILDALGDPGSFIDHYLAAPPETDD